MSYDDWKTRTPDDDPHGDSEVYGPCRDCGAPEGEPCDLLCGCRACREREFAEADRIASGEEDDAA